MDFKKISAGTGFVLLVAFLIIVLIATFMTEYVLEFWISYARGSEVDVPKLPCFFLAIFVGWNVMIPAFIVTLIFDIFV